MLPEKLAAFVEIYRQKVVEQPQNHFLPRWRLEFLYFDVAGIIFNHKRFYGCLAVVTAEKVFPFFVDEMPQEKAPERLIKLARRINKGSIAADSWRVEIYSDYAYQLSGTYWGDWELDSPTSGYFAGFAAYKALWEARGWRFLANWYKNDPSSKASDTEIASSPFSDTAGVASCAYGDTAEKRLEFWQWWFDEAIPQAWDLSISD